MLFSVAVSRFGRGHKFAPVGVKSEISVEFGIPPAYKKILVLCLNRLVLKR